MCEIWKDIAGYEGLYQVSNTGRVKSFDRIVNNYPDCKRRVKGRVLKNSKDQAGYYRVDLKHPIRKRKNMLVHRAVALAFVSNPFNKPHVNHLDGCKTNNDPSNLEWCTHKENMRHAYATGLTPIKKLGRGEMSIAAKLTNMQVREIKARIALGERSVDIAKDYPVSATAINEIKAGRSWGHIHVARGFAA